MIGIYVFLLVSFISIRTKKKNLFFMLTTLCLVVKTVVAACRVIYVLSQAIVVLVEPLQLDSRTRTSQRLEQNQFPPDIDLTLVSFPLRGFH